VSSEPRQPSEEELRAAYEAELKRLRVEDVLLDNVAALVNLAMRRTGLVPGTEEERDPNQVRLAIETVRAMLPVLEQAAPEQIGAIRDAVSQLQIAFVKIGGQPATAASGGPEGSGKAQPQPEAPAPAPAAGSREPDPEPPKPGEPGPAERSGRLWVPGQ
jgi:hypothetical protein